MDIITGVTKVQEFNQFFTREYKYLLGFTRSIDVRNDYESLLHDCYLKAATRISLSGFSGSTYMNFLRCTIMNTYKTRYRDRKYSVDIEHPDYQEVVEERLLEEHEYAEQRKEYDNDMAFLNTMAYEYVNKYFSPREEMIFKTYYVLKHRHLNYKQLSEATNLSQTSVSNTIKTIKKSLKTNLMCYINTGMTMEELAAIQQQVQAILKTDVRANKRNYMDLYFKIFGKHWSGCGCNTGPLREALKAWHDKSLINK